MRFVCFALCVLSIPAFAFADDSPTTPAFWLSRAQTDAGSLTSPAEQAGVLTTIATQWLSLGQTDAAASAADQADAAARRIADPAARYHALLGLAGYYDRAGIVDKRDADLIAAGDAVNSITPADAQTAAQTELNHTRAVAAGLAEARKDIDAQTDAAARTQGYISLALTFAQGGHRDLYHQCMDLAVASLAQISDPKQAAMLQSTIAQTEANAGDLDAAGQSASVIAQPIAQGEAYATLAAAYTQAGQNDAALDAIGHMVNAAGGSPVEARTEMWFRIARAREALGDTAGALKAVDSAVRFAEQLQPADQADAYAVASRLRVELGDSAGAGDLIDQAIESSHGITDAAELPEVYMAIAVAQARSGKGTEARRMVEQAQDAAAKLADNQRHPGGDPAPGTYMEVVQAALANGDFQTAQIIAGGLSDRDLKSQALMAIASADVDRNEYQAAEDTAAQEGSAQAQAAVCGMIAANLARTRTPAEAESWTERLPTPADKIAARLSVAQVVTPPPAPADAAKN